MHRSLSPLFLFAVIFQMSCSFASTDLPVQDRIKSCDPRMAIAAAEEYVKSADALKQPLQLLSAAAVFFEHGRKDEGVFWFYAAQLRVRYQLAFERGDLGQLMRIMLGTIGPPINNYAQQNVRNLDRTLDAVGINVL